MQSDKNVLVQDGKEFYYELGAEEVAFPLEVWQDGAAFLASFLVDAQVDSAEIRRFLGEISGRFRASDFGDEREFEGGDDSEVRKFIDAHFREILGIEGNPGREDQVAFLDANPQLKVRIFSEGYDRIFAPDPGEEAPAKLRIGLGPLAVRCKRILYSPATESVETVRFSHHYHRETEEDRIRRRRALRLAEKGRFQSIRVDWLAIEKLYDKLVFQVDGMRINGEACTEENLAVWQPKVLLTDKSFVVGQIFGRTSVKNA